MPERDRLARIREIEELSINAWPSLTTACYDGWLLRTANCYSRRTNSVQTLYSSTLRVVDKIYYCEHFYESKGQPAVFKITPASCPANLDETLKEQGYGKQALTWVETMDLSALQSRAHDECFRFDTEISNHWAKTFGCMTGTPQHDIATMCTMLKSLTIPACFASIECTGEIMALGIGVLERNHIGIFDVVTAEQHRNQGFGSRLVQGILCWGKSRGAQHSYLQVMDGNGPAQTLYAKFGFTPQYEYWYRKR